jgi:hypothetical protein
MQKFTDIETLTQARLVLPLTQKQNIGGCSMKNYTLVFILSFFLLGCRSIQYVPVEKVRTEYINKTDTFIQKDSFLLHDSIYTERRGDTITTYKTKIVYKIQYREKAKVDTILKVDSIQVPYPIEKKLTKWEQVKMDTGGIAIGICLGFVLLLIISFLVRAYRKT